MQKLTVLVTVPKIEFSRRTMTWRKRGQSVETIHVSCRVNTFKLADLRRYLESLIVARGLKSCRQVDVYHGAELVESFSPAR